MDTADRHIYEFGPFRLDTATRLLSRGSQPVSLTPKVFDTLAVLVRHHGTVVEKEKLLELVWPDCFVEEANLSVNISVLRKSLGEQSNGAQYIETIQRHGYRFAAEVREVSGEDIAPEPVRHDEALAAVGNSSAAAQMSSRSRRHKLIFLGSLLLPVLIAVGLYFNRAAKPEAARQIKSIAILPFKPLQADGNDEYLGLGLADTLITRLGGIRQLIVRPVSAMRKYTSLEQDPLTAGREQKVEAVLDSSLQRDGERLRVTVRLLQVGDGATLWTYQCDEQYCANIFAMQDAISEKVAAALLNELSGAERLRLRQHSTENREAYQLYLKGRYFVNKGRAGQVEKGIELLRQAIAADPTYALAYAGLADAYFGLTRSGRVSPTETMPKAKAAALKALELDDSLAEAHVVLALVKTHYDLDWAGAEQEYRRAAALNPGNAEAHHWYARQLSVLGRSAEALRELHIAQQLDPLSLQISLDIGEALYYARQYDQALRQWRQTLELDGAYPYTRYGMARAYRQKGMHREAISELLLELPYGRNPAVLAELAANYAAQGQRDEALKIAAEMRERERSGYVGRLNMASLYLALGEREQALEWLEKAYAERHIRLIFLQVDPAFDGLRAESGFADLLRRTGLTP